MPTTYHAKLGELGKNIWWAWQPEVVTIFRDIDVDLWRKCNHNPVAFLQEITPERVAARCAEMSFEPRIDSALARLNDYTKSHRTWAEAIAGPLHARPVCYFSAEFGLHESLPLYSGGLGVLAGDHLKTASDLGIPTVGIGLFYAQGYFQQTLDEHGNQQEHYPRNPAEKMPFVRVKDRAGKPLIITVETPSGDIHAGVWELPVGRIRLLLLDSDVDGNSPADRELTARLYGGDRRVRIRQEVLLGVGGMRVLDALGILPGAIHLNEGHCAFAPLELIRQYMEGNQTDFDAAWREVRRMTVFTTHTPVEAGHDRFAPDMIEAHLGSLRRRLRLDEWSMMAMGRVDVNDDTEPFTMTVLAIKTSSRANGVSGLHGHVTRKMWQRLYPGRFENDVPIGHITNGVHVRSYIAPQMGELFSEIIGEDWAGRLTDRAVWERAEHLDDRTLWSVRKTLRASLVEFARRRGAYSAKRRGEPEAEIEAARVALNPEALTIGFARRFATYKRAPLIFRDADRLARVLNDPKRPVQLVFAGKAHPQDEPGKDFIRHVFRAARDPRFRGKVVFIENYDINVARHMVQGVDVWLNNPLRPLEACGTSGEKVILNGGLNFSTLDGWWAEGYDGRNGFAIGDTRVHSNFDVQLQRDSDSLYDVLENQIVPTFFDRNSHGYPHEWLSRVKHSIRSMAWRFCSDRMLMDYMLKLYLPASTGLQS